MAPKVIDYSKSVIYKIEHIDNPELLYVGSTTDFIRRKAEHKRRCKYENGKQYNSKLYQMIRDNGNWESFKIMIISEFPCNNRTDLIIEEEKYRKESQASLNTLKSHRTIKEKKEQNKLATIKYQEKYKEKINKKARENYEINKEQINKEKKEKITCLCGSIFRKDKKARHEKTLKHINFINN